MRLGAIPTATEGIYSVSSGVLGAIVTLHLLTSKLHINYCTHFTFNSAFNVETHERLTASDTISGGFARLTRGNIGCVTLITFPTQSIIGDVSGHRWFQRVYLTSKYLGISPTVLLSIHRNSRSYTLSFPGISLFVELSISVQQFSVQINLIFPAG